MLKDKVVHDKLRPLRPTTKQDKEGCEARAGCIGCCDKVRLKGAPPVLVPYHVRIVKVIPGSGCWRERRLDPDHRAVAVVFGGDTVNTVPVRIDQPGLELDLPFFTGDDAFRLDTLEDTTGPCIPCITAINTQVRVPGGAIGHDLTRRVAVESPWGCKGRFESRVLKDVTPTDLGVASLSYRNVIKDIRSGITTSEREHG